MAGMPAHWLLGPGREEPGREMAGMQDKKAGLQHSPGTVGTSQRVNHSIWCSAVRSAHLFPPSPDPSPPPPPLPPLLVFSFFLNSSASFSLLYLSLSFIFRE